MSKWNYQGVLFFTLILFCCLTSFAQLPFNHNSDILTKDWKAKWINHPDVSGNAYGVYYFRKNINVDNIPDDFIVHISADNRYKFYVNGVYVGNGPARGDKMHWRFESIDLKPFLKLGSNKLSVVVWNFGNLSPGAQHSVRTGLIIQGDSKSEDLINTNNSWHVYNDTAYSAIPININDYYVVGPGENFDGSRHPWGWESLDAFSEDWKFAREGQNGRPLKSMRNYGDPPSRILVPRPIPQMEERPQRFKAVRESTENGKSATINANFIEGTGPLVVQPHSTLKILLDQGVLTNAYPVIKYSKGSESLIKVTYAEGLRDSNNYKHNRNEISGKLMIGNTDIISPDGGEGREFQTLWWRTFRYVQIEIITEDEVIEIIDFSSIFTGYPLEEKATFVVDNPLYDDIWEVGWRTQRLCAGENFFDCPYYEQLQYEGDTRIQCLVSRYVSGDTLLMRNALVSFYDSFLSIGLTQSRYPSKDAQIIPPFSLIWVTMLYDYWMLCDEPELVETLLPAAQNILRWFENHIDDTGMVGQLEWWNFVDWVDSEGWVAGIPPGVSDSQSSIINLQFVYTLQKAQTMFAHFGYDNLVGKYNDLEVSIKEKVLATCFDSNRMLLADNPMKKTFSQHASVFAVLTELYSGDKAVSLLKRIAVEDNLAQCSYYFTFYFIEAMEKIGQGDQFLNMLEPWKEMLTMGLTTFAERPEPSRSDCHAWSASPLYYDLSLICGIKPLTNGFKKVLIKPHLGELAQVSGSIPHRLGDIIVDFKKSTEGKISGQIDLPTGLDGELHIDGLVFDVVGGEAFVF